MCQPAMKDLAARVESCRPVAQDIYLLTLSCPGLETPQPGQFVHLQVPQGGAQLLRRPISVYDFEESRLHLAIQVKGEGTRKITAAAPGSSLQLLGPLGNGFPLSAQRPLLVGGGIGVAPLFYLARCFEGRARAIAGYRSQGYAYQVEELRALCSRLSVVTDDGSLGVRATVAVPLRRALQEGWADAVYACGPTPMLRAVQQIMEEFPQVPCYLSLEERMGCGVGACVTCSVKILQEGQWHYKRVCADGPVFLAKEVVFA